MRYILNIRGGVNKALQKISQKILFDPRVARNIFLAFFAQTQGGK